MPLISSDGKLLIQDGKLAVDQQCCVCCTCTVDQTCCNHQCCDTVCCAGECCAENEVCCNGACCPPGWHCCGGECCQPDHYCLDGVCVPSCPEPKICGTKCCSDIETCCVDTCCSATETCIDGACCPDYRTCGTTCCAPGETCVDGTCIPACEYAGCPDCTLPQNREEFFPATGVCDQAPAMQSSRYQQISNRTGPYGAIAGDWPFLPWNAANDYPARLYPGDCQFFWVLDVFNQLCQGTINGVVYCVYKVHYRWRLFQARKNGAGCDLVDITADAISEPNAYILEGSYCNNADTSFYDPACAGECDAMAAYFDDPVMDCNP